MAHITASLTRRSNTTFMKTVDPLMQRATWREFSMFQDAGGQESVKMEWMGEWSGVEQFKDERKYDAVPQHEYTITAREWEKSTAIQKKYIESDRDLYTSMIEPRIRQMATLWVSHPQSLFITKLTSTTDTNTPYGTTFFSSAIPIDESSSTNSNLVSGTGVTAANIIADFDEAMEYFLNFKTRSGDYVFESREGLTFTIWHSPALTGVMEEVFIDAPVVGDATTGKRRGRATPVALARLTGNDWYVVINNLPIKPFVYFQVKPVEWEWFDDTFKHKVWRYGAYAFYDYHYGYWQTIIKVDN